MLGIKSQTSSDTSLWICFYINNICTYIQGATNLLSHPVIKIFLICVHYKQRGRKNNENRYTSTLAVHSTPREKVIFERFLTDFLDAFFDLFFFFEIFFDILFVRFLDTFFRIFDRYFGRFFDIFLDRFFDIFFGKIFW